MKRTLAVGLPLFCVLLFTACQGSVAVPPGFQIVEAKMCRQVDAERNPLDIVSKFPEGTNQVYCWFVWKDAKPGLEVVVTWYYASEDLKILATPLKLTRIADQGVSSLRLPPGKTLPPGDYRVELSAKGRPLTTVTFTVEKTPPPQTPQ